MNTPAHVPWKPLLAVGGFYLLVYSFGQLVHTGLYTVDWTMWWLSTIFAPISLVAAMFGGWRGAIYSCVGYLAGLLAGDLIGGPISDAQWARLQEQLKDPNYSQNWEPHHPGWWISILTCLAFSIVGLVLGLRAKRRTQASMRSASRA